MKSFNEISESHDETGKAWPVELLGMSVDELLDRFKHIDPVVYKELEAIIGRRIDAIIGNEEEGTTDDEMLTFNELDSAQQLSDIEAKLKTDVSPDTRKFLMQKAQELRGESRGNLDTFTFNG